MYDRIELTMPKGQKAIIKEKAALLGQSANEFIYSAIQEKIKKLEKQFKIKKKYWLVKK